MTDTLLKMVHFDTLNGYRSLLSQLPQQAVELKTAMGLDMDAEFHRIYQPALDMTILYAKGHFDTWPKILEAPYEPIYLLININKDILLFFEQFSSWVNTMSAEEKRNYLSSLDLDRPPFQLNGQLKYLKVCPALKFAESIKGYIYQCNHAMSDTAFVTELMYTNSYSVIPRFIEFLKGAILRYAEINKLNADDGDRIIIGTRKTIANMSTKNQGIIEAAQELNETYSQLDKYLLDAYNELKDMYGTLGIEEFRKRMEAMLPHLSAARSMVNVE